MTPDDREWAEKTALRLAECGAEIRRLPDRLRHPRRAKLEARADRYIALLARLRERLPRSEREDISPPDLVAVEEEVERLKERLWGAATSLVRDRHKLNELRSRFTRPTPENGLDFSLEPSEETTSRTQRAAHEILRSLGL